MDERSSQQPQSSLAPHPKTTLDVTKGSHSLSALSPPVPPPLGVSFSGDRGSSTSFIQHRQTATTLPPPAMGDDAEDTFDVTVPFVLPTSVKRAPLTGVLPRRFARSSVRKPDKKSRSRDSPSFLESTASVVEGQNPIALLKEEQPQLKSALKCPKPLAQIDEVFETGTPLSESPDDYGMAQTGTPTTYNNSSFARPFPNRMCEMLIADDSHRNRRIMSQILQLAGYVCDTAYDGQMAVDKVDKGPPTVTFSLTLPIVTL